jgi:hypothetical protein
MVDQVINSLCFSLVLRFVPHDALSFSRVSPAAGTRLALRACLRHVFHCFRLSIHDICHDALNHVVCAVFEVFLQRIE